jgi:hypothetical protein
MDMADAEGLARILNDLRSMGDRLARANKQQIDLVQLAQAEAAARVPPQEEASRQGKKHDPRGGYTASNGKQPTISRLLA